MPLSTNHNSARFPHLVLVSRNMDATEERKRKLNAIRESAGKNATKDSEQPSKLKFRNYQPYDANLKKNVIESEDPLKAPADVDLSVDIIKRELTANTTDDLYILPKKVNWDLKQQVENDIAKLKRRTQKAIVEILREKLKAANDDEEE